jgi:hypothetical protein
MLDDETHRWTRVHEWVSTMQVGLEASPKVREEG